MIYGLLILAGVAGFIILTYVVLDSDKTGELKDLD
jgi:hypothetical protein